MLIVSFFISSVALAQQGPGTIYVSVSGFRSDNGWALAGLFRSSKGFPSDFIYTFRTATAEINDGQASMVFPNVPLGEYAISIVHDTDMDVNFDRNWAFLPAEGYGTSNDTRGVFGPGDYSGSKFITNASEASIYIPIHY